MKRLISVLLLLTIAVSLIACGASEGGTAAGGNNSAATFDLKEGQLAVGYGKVNITPEDSMPLGGFGNPEQRMSTGFQSYIYATCIAITDTEGNSALLFGVE